MRTDKPEMNPFEGITLDLQLVTLRDVTINLLMAFALGLFLGWVYRRSHRGFSYSASFVQTLIFLGMVTSLVIMVIGNSIALAFSLVGALSIIRFRTPVKDTRDTAFVFFSLAIGMATGTGVHAIAVLGTVIICILILVVHRLGIGEVQGRDYLLRFRMHNEPDAGSLYQPLFDRHLRQCTLVNMSTLEDGAMMELSFSISFKHTFGRHPFTRELSAQPAIEQVILIAVGEEME